MLLSRISSAALLLAAIPISSLSAQSADEIIAKARSFVGSEEALQAIQSLEYHGTVHQTETGDTQELSLYLLKPSMQRQELAMGSGYMTQAVDGYDGWMFFVKSEEAEAEMADEADTAEAEAAPANDAGPERMFRVLRFDEIRNMQAMTRENLYFFKESVGLRGKVIDKGLTERDGDEVVWLQFDHGGGNVFDRYFDPETGKLLATRVADGSVWIEEGEIVIDGIKFPASTKMIVDGEVVTEIVFDTIKVNSGLSEGDFSIPDFDEDGLPPAEAAQLKGD
jgi:outer membrane lipoprotein-sorting protein